jgi:CheY-like chemotaxis protein
MPNKSGMRFLREMRRNKAWSNIPFVIVTAHAHDELGREDLNDILSTMTVSGPNVYLEKPVAPENYVRLICERLGVELEQTAEEIEIDDLRRELANLIKGATPDQLKQAIRALKKK